MHHCMKSIATVFKWTYSQLTENGVILVAVILSTHLYPVDLDRLFGSNQQGNIR